MNLKSKQQRSVHMRPVTRDWSGYVAVQQQSRGGVCLQVSYLHHKELVQPVTKTEKAWDKIEYYRIANHYRYIFKTFFECFDYPHVIILEVSWLTSTLRHSHICL